MDLLFILLTGVLTSLVASLVWLWAISRLRPKIQISNQIAKAKSSAGRTVYKIKIINKSKRAIVNIRAELNLAIPKIVKGGDVVTLKEIPLVDNERLFIGKFDLSDTKAEYAFRFLININLDRAWKNDSNSYLTFRVYSTDSLSSLGELHQKAYKIKRNSIVQGDFSFGNSMEIS